MPVNASPPRQGRLANQHGPLPSFDDLVKSISRPSSGAGTPIPFTKPRRTPSPPPAPLSLGLDRSPSSPGLQGANAINAITIEHPKGHSRRGSAPSIYDVSPTSTPPVTRPDEDPLLLAAGSIPCSHSLGLSPSHPSTPGIEHYGDRIQEIRDGDGDLELTDAVAPEILPPCARPSMHHRRSSSTSSYSSPPTAPLRRTTSGSYAYSPSPYTHALGQSSGAHSPLTYTDPLTPRSLRPSGRSSPLQQEEKGVHGSVAKEKGGFEGKVRIPTLPGM